MMRRRMRGLLAMALGLVMGGSAYAADSRSERIVSINLCADQLLLLLVEPERIRSLSYFALDPDESYFAERAASHHINHVTADEVLALEPDLVLAGAYTKRSTVDLLKREGVRVVEIAVPASLSEVQRQFRRVADLLGARPRAERLLAEMTQRLDAVPSRDKGKRPLAAVYFANGLTAGKGTLMDDVMRHAGIENLATRLGIQGYGTLSLESLLVAEPDMLVFGHISPEDPSLARMTLEHPAFRNLRERVTTVALPRRIWTCWGPFTAEWVERLAVARP